MHPRQPEHAPAFAFLTAVAVMGIAAAAAAEEPIATAMFTDGTEIGGPVTDLADPGKAAVAKRLLFAADPPVRWVRIGSPDSAGRDAFVEFDTGDRLPGRVLGHEPEGFAWETIPAAAQPMNHPASRPALLLVASPGDVSAGVTRRGRSGTVTGIDPIRIRRDRVRRVVWQGGATRGYQPRTLFLATGGMLTFRSLRWFDKGLIALLENGATERHEFTAIAEVHLAPRSDPWSSWFESLVDDSGVVRIETRSGSRVTTPRSRLRPAPGAASPLLMTQPSWSVEPLLLPANRIVAISAFAADEMPLSALEPAHVTQRSAFGGSWVWRADRNVQGGPLVPAGPSAGWGFGVHARTELAFPLWDGVQAFRGRVGLDRIVGRGGCVRAAVHADDAAAPPLWRSDVLVGSGTWADCGTVALTGSAGCPRVLMLVADDAHHDRPAGADPFDIRDVVDWCDPLLVLDRQRVRSQVSSRVPFVVPAWAGWTVTPAAGGSIATVSAIDPVVGHERAGWAAATICAGGPLRLAREWPALRQQDRYLVIAVNAVGAASGAIDVRVDDWHWTLPLPARSDRLPAAPFVISLAGRPAGPLAVEITVPDGLAVHWHALGLADDLEGSWFGLEPVAMESSAGSKFSTRADGAILVSLPAPEVDDYTIRLRSRAGGIRAIRIDALRDPSLKQGNHGGGPGRHVFGRFRMSSLTMSGGTAGGERPLDIVAAYVDPLPLDPAYGPMAAVQPTEHHFWDGAQGVPSSAVFQLRKDDMPAEQELEIRMEFRANHREHATESLGCFRILGSEAADARLPVTIATWLVRQADEPGTPARATIVGKPTAERRTP